MRPSTENTLELNPSGSCTSSVKEIAGSHQDCPMVFDKVALREIGEIAVLQVWNEQSKIGGYKPHRSLLPDARQAIRKIIKEGYDYESIKSAIRNYAYTLSDSRFFFKYNQWTLAQFLSRGSRDDKGKRWLWFHPDYFNEEKWWTKQVREQNILNRELLLAKEKIQNSKPITGLPKVALKSVPNYDAEAAKEQQARRVQMRKDLEAKTGIRL